nr:hypothetical protein [Paraburkholderia sprentiae]
MPVDPEFGSDGEPALSPAVEPDRSVGPVPLEGAGDEPFATVVAPPGEVAIPELVVPVELAMPAVPVPVEGAAAVPDGFAELPVEEPPASAVPLPPPPHALNTTLPPSAVRLPRN